MARSAPSLVGKKIAPLGREVNPGQRAGLGFAGAIVASGVALIAR